MNLTSLYLVSSKQDCKPAYLVDCYNSLRINYFDPCFYDTRKVYWYGYQFKWQLSYIED